MFRGECPCCEQTHAFSRRGDIYIRLQHTHEISRSGTLSRWFLASVYLLSRDLLYTPKDVSKAVSNYRPTFDEQQASGFNRGADIRHSHTLGLSSSGFGCTRRRQMKRMNPRGAFHTAPREERPVGPVRFFFSVPSRRSWSLVCQMSTPPPPFDLPADDSLHCSSRGGRLTLSSVSSTLCGQHYLAFFVDLVVH